MTGYAPAGFFARFCGRELTTIRGRRCRFARHPADGPPASALTAIHVPQEWHRRRPVATRGRFPIELLAFLPFSRPLGLLHRRRVTLTWQPRSRTSVLVCTILLAGRYPLPKIGIKRWPRAPILVRAAFHALRHEMPSGRRSCARQRPWGTDGRYHNLGWRVWIQWMGGKPIEGCRDDSAAKRDRTGNRARS